MTGHVLQDPFFKKKTLSASLLTLYQDPWDERIDADPEILTGDKMHDPKWADPSKWQSKKRMKTMLITRYKGFSLDRQPPDVANLLI